MDFQFAVSSVTAGRVRRHIQKRARSSILQRHEISSGSDSGRPLCLLGQGAKCLASFYGLLGVSGGSLIILAILGLPQMRFLTGPLASRLRAAHVGGTRGDGRSLAYWSASVPSLF